MSLPVDQVAGACECSWRCTCLRPWQRQKFFVVPPGQAGEVGQRAGGKAEREAFAAHPLLRAAAPQRRWLVFARPWRQSVARGGQAGARWRSRRSVVDGMQRLIWNTPAVNFSSVKDSESTDLVCASSTLTPPLSRCRPLRQEPREAAAAKRGVLQHDTARRSTREPQGHWQQDPGTSSGKSGVWCF